MNRKLLALALVASLASGEVLARGIVLRRTAPAAPPSTGVVYLTAGTTTWTPPTGFTPGDNQVEAIGGGGSGSFGQASVSNSHGGGGGVYAITLNVPLTAGVPVTVQVGAGGAAPGAPNTVGNAGGDTYLCTSTSNCSSIADTAVGVGAKGGSGGNLGLTGAFGGLGGQASASVGTTKFTGGNGGSTPQRVTGSGGGGGGGAACSLGIGGDGGTGLAAGGSGGGGGGGACGYWGITPRQVATYAGEGGFGKFGGNYGLAGNRGAIPTSGGVGTNGSGGGGGGGGTSTNCSNGGNGGSGIDMDATHGSGGGGGSAGLETSGTPACSGGNGALYGGGGGGANLQGIPGRGGDGLIKVTWPKPPTPPPSTYAGLTDTRYTCVKTLWVSATGNNANDGSTPALARQQIGNTLNLFATPGTCVRVLPGHYASDSSFNTGRITNGGNQDSLTGYIALVCDTPLTCFLEPSTTVNVFNVVDITQVPNSVNFVIVDGFDIHGGSLRIFCGGQTSCDGNAVESEFNHHIKIINNNIHDCAAAGIQTGWMDYLLAQNNHITRCAYYGSSAYSGISLAVPWYADKASGTHYEIAQNFIWGNAMSTFLHQPHSDGNGIILDNYGNQREYLGTTIIENNTVFHNGTRGIEVLCNTGGNTATVDMTIRNNTTYHNANDIMRSGSTGDIFTWGCNGKDVIVNNIMVCDPALSAVIGPPHCLFATADLNQSIIANNIIWPGQSTNVSPYIQTQVTVTNGVNGNMFVNPLLTAPSNNKAVADWHLQTGSPGIGAGTLAYGAAAKDAAGNPRVVGGLIDIGAYQGGHTSTWARAGSALDIDFANGLIPSTTMSTYFTVTRSESLGQATDMLPSSPPGYAPVGYSPNTPRLAYSGSDTAGPGLLIEPARTNYFISSLYPQTQTISLPAGTFTLWVNGFNFYGGTATLSGCASGVADVTGAQVHFTLGAPASCTVTVTNNGGATHSDLMAVQLEDGPTATSYIPTPQTGGTATRGAEVVQLTGVALSTLIGSAASVLVNANGSPNTGGIYILQGDGYTLMQSTSSTTITSLSPTLTATFGSGMIAGETKSFTSWDATGRSLIVNNGTAATDSNVPAANTVVTFGGTQGTPGNEYTGSMSELAIWASRISGTGLTTVP